MVVFLAGIAAALVLGGCVGTLGPEVTPIPTRGDFAIGVTSMVVEDPSRERELPTEVWYPAAGDAPEHSTMTYAVDALGATVARLHSHARAHSESPPRRHGAPYSVVLVSHGTGSSRFGNVTLCEVLASHGYIVAAVDHVGDTIDDSLFGVSFEERALNMTNRPLDLTRVLDALEARSKDPHSLLSGMVDTNHVAVMGHSFGATTALAMVGASFDAPRQARDCELNPDNWKCALAALVGSKTYRYREPRVKAAVLIAPGGYDVYRSDGIGTVDAPTLVVGGTHDTTNPWDAYPKPTYDALRSPRYLLRLKDGGHLTATDVCDVVQSIGFFGKTFGGEKAADGCEGRRRAFMTPRRANVLVARAVIPFLEIYLHGDRTAEPALDRALKPEIYVKEP